MDLQGFSYLSFFPSGWKCPRQTNTNGASSKRVKTRKIALTLTVGLCLCSNFSLIPSLPSRISLVWHSIWLLLLRPCQVSLGPGDPQGSSLISCPRKGTHEEHYCSQRWCKTTKRWWWWQWYYCGIPFLPGGKRKYFVFFAEEVSRALGKFRYLDTYFSSNK